MANKNFIVQNGLTVGGVTIDATSGNITTTGVLTTTNSEHPAEFQGNLSVGGTLTVGGVAVNGSAGGSTVLINPTFSGGPWRTSYATGPYTLGLWFASASDAAYIVAAAATAGTIVSFAISSTEYQGIISSVATSTNSFYGPTAYVVTFTMSGAAPGYTLPGSSGTPDNSPVSLITSGTAGLTVDSDFIANAGAFTTLTADGLDIETQLTSTGVTSDTGTLSVGGPQSFSDYGLMGSFVANIPAYSYVSVQNRSTGGNASASFAAYNDSEAFIDLGINSSQFSANASGFVNNSVNQPNASYVYAQGGDMVLGTWTNNGIHFITNAATTVGDSMFISGNGNVYISGNLTVTGNTSVTNTVTNFTTQTANVIQVAYLEGNSSINSGAITVTGNILPSANVTYNLGSSAKWYGTYYGVATQAKYADLAENYQADAAYKPGQVVEFGGTHEVTIGSQDTTRVAGVISTNPAHLMNGALTGINVVAVALQGRVPCNVIGPVRKGDLMISAGFGFAKAQNLPIVGQVIGKALEDFDGGKGQIEIVVGRH